MKFYLKTSFVLRPSKKLIDMHIFIFLLKKYTYVHTIVRSRPKGVFEYIIYSLSLPTCVVVQKIYKNNL